MTQEIIYPPEGSCGKFVQLYIQQGESRIPILRASDEDGIRHGTILMNALKEHSLEFKATVDIGYPELKSASYEAVGMGKYEFNDGIFTAFAYSSDYEIMSDEEHFKKLQEIDSEFKFSIREDTVMKIMKRTLAHKQMIS